jgi:hypothetical protein
MDGPPANTVDLEAVLESKSRASATSVLRHQSPKYSNRRTRQATIRVFSVLHMTQSALFSLTHGSFKAVILYYARLTYKHHEVGLDAALESRSRASATSVLQH